LEEALDLSYDRLLNEEIYTCNANLVFDHCALERNILLEFTEKLKDCYDKILIYAEREREIGGFKVKPAG
jgi:hypothetical protein